ncbi:MAG: hypothetical protein ACLR8Y_18305 [Alistipes indistinctus]
MQIGDRLKGYVSRITEDNRVDVALQQQGYDEVKKSAARLVELSPSDRAARCRCQGRKRA